MPIVPTRRRDRAAITAPDGHVPSAKAAKQVTAAAPPSAH